MSAFRVVLVSAPKDKAEEMLPPVKNNIFDINEIRNRQRKLLGM